MNKASSSPESQLAMSKSPLVIDIQTNDAIATNKTDINDPKEPVHLSDNVPELLEKE